MMPDAATRKAYARLKPIRERTDLKLRKSPLIKPTFTGWDGEEHELRFRYYQVQGILHMLTMSRFLLGDDTGLGKTIMSIASLCYVWEKEPDRKAIVVTNKSPVGQWCDEFEKFTPAGAINVIRCQGSPKKRAKAYQAYKESEGPTVLVMGYGSLRQDFSELQDWEGHIIIYDEAQAFKNPKTQIHAICKHMSSQANRVWCLTATMIMNNLSEGYGIFQVMLAGTNVRLFPTSLTGFYNEYYVMRLQKIGKGGRQVPLPVYAKKGATEKFKMLIDPYYLGRAKHDVAPELPPLTIQVRKCGMTKAQKLKYDEALAGLLEMDKTDEVKETTQLTSLIYCQEIVDHPDLVDCEGDSDKLKLLLEILTEGDFAEQNVIVYTRFSKMVDLLMPILAKKKVEAVRITGKETKTVTFQGKKMTERDVSMKRFQDPKDKARVCVITSAASASINLQSAKLIIFYDTPWSAGDYLQTLGRMIRIGSVHDRVYAIHLAAKDTIDEKVLKVIRGKMKIIEAILGKRIKGDAESDLQVDDRNNIGDLYRMMRKSAEERGKR